MERKLVPFRIACCAAAAVLVPVALCAQSRPAGAAPLPAVPRSAGPLAVTIVYPLDGQLLTARDSSFFFGSTGHGDALLTVDGVSVPVAPNGAFLAYLALPADTAADLRFVARRGADSVERLLRIRLPASAAPPAGGAAAWIEPSSIGPRGARWVEPGELVRVSCVASPDATVTLELPGGGMVSLVPDTALTLTYGPFDRTLSRRAVARRTRYTATIAATALGAPLPDVTAALPGAAPDDTSRAAWLSVRAGGDSVRVRAPLRVSVLDPARRRVVLLDDDTARAGNTDGVVVGAPLPGGTFHWFFRNGTPAAVSGRAGDQLRLQLSDASVAWVGLDGVAAALPEGTPPPRAVLGLVRLFPETGVVAARFRLSDRVPFRVDEEGRRLTVRFYGAQADLDWVQYGGTDPFVPRVAWAQPAQDEVAVTFELSRSVFGWRSRWEGTDLVVEIRRPPAIDRRVPLRGRVIAVDPGHPPGGATGPTGLREAQANLGIALALQRLLARAGAEVVMTRTTDTAVGLYERTVLAEAAGAELLVSVHNNAFPDGVNPWANNGTSTYYFHPRSARLAFLVQQGMVAQLGLRDLGVGRGDLALARPTWMPAVLTEGAFLMIPEQEHALRTASVQERYARGVVRGIEAFFRELAQER